MKSILIVEDNPTMVKALEDNFTFKGYKVQVARDGEQGLKAALAGKADLIVLDIMLPKINGFEICSKVREKNLDVPIVMLTAKDREDDIIMGLNLGADDYVTKPFSIKELLARAEALLRRTGEAEPDVYEFGNCRFDVDSEKLTRDGREIALSPKELGLLRLFLKKQGRVLTRDEILSNAFGYSHFISSKNVDEFVDALRGKIEPEPNRPRFIRSVLEVGYKFETGEADGDSSDS